MEKVVERARTVPKISFAYTNVVWSGLPLASQPGAPPRLVALGRLAAKMVRMSVLADALKSMYK